MKNILDDFEKYLFKHPLQIQSPHPFFNDALNQMLSAGGKRFRPRLLLGVVNAYFPALVKNSFDAAHAIELFHTYSLIHDDLPCMDNADLRRGQKTIHKTYDETTAVLVGDALNTHAFNILANAKLANDVKIDLVKSLSDDGGINGMIIGQAIDCHFENKNLNFEEIKFMHIHKTAKLIATSLRMGAIVVQEEELSKALYKFGLTLGLLFQVEDDIIDVTQSEQIAGKTVNNDQNKNSFVRLLGLDSTKALKNELLETLKLEITGFKNEKLQHHLSGILRTFIDFSKVSV